jgi:hypothetical protein
VTWILRVTDVRPYELGYRWQLEASTDDLTTVVWADTTRSGHLVGLQSDEYVHTSGDIELDGLIERCVLDAIASRNARSSLDAIDVRRPGRSDRLRGAWQ